MHMCRYVYDLSLYQISLVYLHCFIAYHFQPGTIFSHGSYDSFTLYKTLTDVAYSNDR
jgi:hypothetical protein